MIYSCPKRSFRDVIINNFRNQTNCFRLMYYWMSESSAARLFDGQTRTRPRYYDLARKQHCSAIVLAVKKTCVRKSARTENNTRAYVPTRVPYKERCAFRRVKSFLCVRRARAFKRLCISYRRGRLFPPGEERKGHCLSLL